MATTLGSKIQQRRDQLGLSLRSLADQVGVTASFLSQVERGQANPSLKSLQAIAKTLQVPLYHLLAEDQVDSYLVQQGQAPRLPLTDENFEYEIRSPGDDPKILALVVHCQSGHSIEAVVPKQATQKCIYVTEGRLQVDLKNGSFTLEAGDSITFEGEVLRRLNAVGDKSVTYLSFSTPRL